MSIRGEGLGAWSCHSERVSFSDRLEQRGGGVDENNRAY